MGSTGKLAKALRALARVLEDLSAPAMLIGGMAVIARGLARTTRDIDVAVLGGKVPLDRLLARLKKSGFEPRTKDPLGARCA